MDAEYVELFRQPRRARYLEKRSQLLVSLLKEHGLDEPKSVEYSPLVGARQKRCFANVEMQVARAGGRTETGWIFCEHENICLFTEAHSIWITPQGKRRDITPHKFPPDKRILFLPDPAVAAKRGYSSHRKTIVATDPRLIAIERFDTELSRIFSEHYVGINREIEIPTDEVRAAAKAVSIPDDVARYVFDARIEHFSRP